MDQDSSKAKIRIFYDYGHHEADDKPEETLEEQKNLISNVSGSISQGELVAILGGSGAGKSTLLNILAGRIEPTSGAKLEGKIFLNGFDIVTNPWLFQSVWRPELGYVEQQDRMYEFLTVRETLEISEGLARNSRNCDVNAPTYPLTEKYLKLLGLDRLEGHMVTAIEGTTGRRWHLSSFIKGILWKLNLVSERPYVQASGRISGGERKRVAIGIEVVRNPKWLFLDEPTSGLDAMTALSVVTLLKELTKSHQVDHPSNPSNGPVPHQTSQSSSSGAKGVLMTIHQPRYRVLELFDRILLLAKCPADMIDIWESDIKDQGTMEDIDDAMIAQHNFSGGKIVFHGSIMEACEYFDNLGYKAGKNENPGDYFIDLINESTHENPLDHPAAPDHAIDQTSSPPRDNPASDLSPIVNSSSIQKLRICWLIHIWDLIEHTPLSTMSITVRKPRKLLKEAESSKKVVHFPNSFVIRRQKLKASLSMSSEKGSPDLSPLGSHGKPSSRVCSFFASVFLLIRRSLKDTFRNREYLFASALQVLIFTLLLGLVFFNLSNSFPSVQNRTGLIFFFIINVTFSTISPLLGKIPAEIPLMRREVYIGQTSPLMVYMAKVISGLPLLVLMNTVYSALLYWMTRLYESLDRFLVFYVVLLTQLITAQGLGYLIGSLFSSQQAAQALGPTIVITWVIFAGNFVNIKTVPGYLTWISWIDPIRYSFAALLQNEFYGQSFECNPLLSQLDSNCVLKGEEVVQNLALDKPTLWISYVYLVAIGVSIHVIACLVLRSRLIPKLLPT